MCGLTGFWRAGGGRSDDMRATVESMAAALRHRGPDDDGQWINTEAGVAFGFRRLSIIDLTTAGHQPMQSHSGRYTIVFNGEVYNFSDIAAELRTIDPSLQFRGHSDTEVILEAIEKWGLEGALERFIGMFAFALWDAKDRRLQLVRDRLGVKPLYYASFDDVLMFASEIKALRRHPAFSGRLRKEAVNTAIHLGYVPAPLTIYENVVKVEPGTICTFAEPSSCRVRRYWSPAQVVREGRAHPFAAGLDEAADELDELLRSSISLRLISDVPVGVFLSGGIDSSTVTAVMRNISNGPVRSFSIGFGPDEFNEAPHARAIARHLGTEHTELYISSEDALAVIPKLPAMFDEPFADHSQIPTYLVSALARTSVTVSLSGDGGDELFGGYNRHMYAPRLWNAASRLPRGTRRSLGSAIRSVPASVWPYASAAFSRMGARQLHLQDKAGKFANALSAASSTAFYELLVSQWTDEPILSPDVSRSIADPRWNGVELDSVAEQMMYYDMVRYLPDDILVKVDRASMSVSLESREPLLDHRIVEFAWRLPLSMKIAGGESKRVLRRVLHRYVPADFFRRPKSGFEVPLAEWLRGPLREWAESLLEERSLDSGIFNRSTVTKAWREHLSGRVNRQHGLWNVLMFRAWQEATVVAP